MNILITGSNGQLGKSLQKLQNNSSHTFFNTDINELDITNTIAIENYIAENHIDGIINCAAYTAVDKAESEHELCQKLNAEAPAYLANAIEKQGGWLIHISTDYVFDGKSYRPYQEDDDTQPNTEYGKTKLVGELNVLKLCKQCIVIRTAWLYSAYGNNFVKTMMRLGQEREQLGVVFDQIGTPTYALDLAKVIMTIVDSGIKPGIYHYTNEGVTSWYDFTLAIHRHSGINKCRVNPIHTEDYPTPALRPHFSVLDKTKIKNTYNVNIPHWEVSLQSLLKEING